MHGMAFCHSKPNTINTIILVLLYKYYYNCNKYYWVSVKLYQSDFISDKADFIKFIAPDDRK